MREANGTILTIPLDEQEEAPLYHQIYHAVQQFTLSGALKKGTRLPSIRSMAQAHGISRQPVEKAYLQLAVEGYVDNVPRSGFVVREVEASFLQATQNHEPTSQIDIAPERMEFMGQYKPDPNTRYDFTFTRLPNGSFPAKQWMAAANTVLYNCVENKMCSYPDEHAPSKLQEELASYLRRTRGVVCCPEQVIVTPSTEAALQTVLALFRRTDDTVALEEPGFTTLAIVAKREGFALRRVRCDAGGMHFIEQIRAINPKVVFVTPSHQFPTGHVMKLDTRVELLRWAQANDSYIIEDDACSEYRYDVDPIPSLQSLDGGHRVIYLGTLSKVFSPALRIAYAVLPLELMGTWQRTFYTTSTQVSVLEQETIAHLIENGDYERHVRRVVMSMKTRHDALLAALTQELGGAVELSGVHSGMHLYAKVSNGMNEDQLIESAARQGARVYPTTPYWGADADHDPALMIGFSAIPKEDIVDGVQALRRAWL